MRNGDHQMNQSECKKNWCRDYTRERIEWEQVTIWGENCETINWLKKFAYATKWK